MQEYGSTQGKLHTIQERFELTDEHTRIMHLNDFYLPGQEENIPDLDKDTKIKVHAHLLDPRMQGIFMVQGNPEDSRNKKRQPMGRKVNYKGWQLPGGELRNRPLLEEPLNGLAREVREETGFTIQKHLVNILFYQVNGKKELRQPYRTTSLFSRYVYVCTIPEVEFLNNNFHSVDRSMAQGQWFPVDQLAEKFAWTNQALALNHQNILINWILNNRR